MKDTGEAISVERHWVVFMINVAMKILIWLVCFLAWFFAVGTVLAVCWAFLSCMGNPDSHNGMMSSEIDDAWGLTYTGRHGAPLALAEAVIVVLALWASRTRKATYRPIGHLILILWAALWMANAFYVLGDGTFNLIYVMSFLFLCTCLRVILDLKRRSLPVSA
jgi:hypothetical protein